MKDETELERLSSLLRIFALIHGEKDAENIGQRIAIDRNEERRRNVEIYVACNLQRDSFTYYRRQVTLQSCMRNFCVVIVTEIDDIGYGNTLEFDIDYDTMKIHFQSTQCRKMTQKVIDAFNRLYAEIRICFDQGYKDERTDNSIPTLLEGI